MCLAEGGPDWRESALGRWEDFTAEARRTQRAAEAGEWRPHVPLGPRASLLAWATAELMKIPAAARAEPKDWVQCIRNRMGFKLQFARPKKLSPSPQHRLPLLPPVLRTKPLRSLRLCVEVFQSP